LRGRLDRKSHASRGSQSTHGFPKGISELLVDLFAAWNRCHASLMNDFTLSAGFSLRCSAWYASEKVAIVTIWTLYFSAIWYQQAREWQPSQYTPSCSLIVWLCWSGVLSLLQRYRLHCREFSMHRHKIRFCIHSFRLVCGRHAISMQEGSYTKNRWMNG
jgi:hypothetical protein